MKALIGDLFQALRAEAETTDILNAPPIPPPSQDSTATVLASHTSSECLEEVFESLGGLSFDNMTIDGDVSVVTDEGTEGLVATAVGGGEDSGDTMKGIISDLFKALHAESESTTSHN